MDEPVIDKEDVRTIQVLLADILNELLCQSWLMEDMTDERKTRREEHRKFRAEAEERVRQLRERIARERAEEAARRRAAESGEKR